ncbi:MAG: hypothetical protein ABIJ09_12070 [Pseudomonadota bacterium]
MDDREMREKIDRTLDAHEKKFRSRAARLAAAVGASGKLLAGCIVVEYGAPLYGVAEYAAPFDAAVDDAGDAGSIDLGPVVDYAAPFDAGDDAGSATLYGIVPDGGTTD